jgi:3-methyl-2-oxobutanoate hydroxymethyltransferase
MAEEARKKVTIAQLVAKKQNRERIAALAVYDCVLGEIADAVGFDLLVVGVAGPMSMFGHKDPTTVRFEEQLFMVQAVSRVAKYGFIVVDMSWGTYQTKEDALHHARRLIAEGGADAIKCEGNFYTAPIIAEIVRAGIPVMGHLGMLAAHRTEQSGYGLKGRKAEEAAEIVESARAYVEAGAFAFMLEQIPTEITEYLASSLPVPVISLGAGIKADGIFHIASDLLGYGSFKMPPRRERFVDLYPIIKDAMQSYKDRVLARTHPKEDTPYHMKPEEHERFLKMVKGGELDLVASTYYGRARRPAYLTSSV